MRRLGSYNPVRFISKKSKKIAIFSLNKRFFLPASILVTVLLIVGLIELHHIQLTDSADKVLVHKTHDTQISENKPVLLSTPVQSKINSPTIPTTTTTTQSNPTATYTPPVGPSTTSTPTPAQIQQALVNTCSQFNQESNSQYQSTVNKLATEQYTSEYNAIYGNGGYTTTHFFQNDLNLINDDITNTNSTIKDDWNIDFVEYSDAQCAEFPPTKPPILQIPACNPIITSSSDYLSELNYCLNQVYPSLGLN